MKTWNLGEEGEAEDAMWLRTEPDSECPICPEEPGVINELSYESPDIEGGGVYQGVSCPRCGRSWTDVYHFAGIWVEGIPIGDDPVTSGNVIDWPAPPKEELE